MPPVSNRKKAEILGDLHAYGGALLFSIGAGWAYPPAGLIVFGVFLAWLGLFWRSKA